MDGPCIIIEWRDKKNGRGWLTSRYFPLKGESMHSAEMACFEWFKKRHSELRSMTWAWGEVSKYVTKNHRLVLG